MKDKNQRYRALAAAALTVWFILAPSASVLAQAPAPEVTVIRAGRLFDPVSGRLLTGRTIVVEGERIRTVGEEAAVPPGARVIDLSDATVLPGLIDCHVHITGQSSRRDPNALYIDNSVIAHLYLRPTLEAGFTSVRSLGSNSFDDVYLQRAVDRGLLEGPRIQPASFYISSTGGHGDATPRNPWAATNRPPEHTGVADGVDEVRRKVRYLVKMGAGVIKMGAGAGVLSGEDSVAAPQYSQAEMNAIVEEAHRWERKVAAHAHGAEAIKMALRAGVDSIEHGSLIDDEGIRLMKEKGVYLVADVYVSDYILAEYRSFGVSERILEKERMVGQAQRENFRKAVRAGVRVAFGTDAGVFPHGRNAGQFAYMTKWGMTPAEAIRAATSDAADLLGWADRVGSIEPGKYADIIAVGGDPTRDVSVLEDVRFVMKGGRVYKNSFGR